MTVCERSRCPDRFENAINIFSRLIKIKKKTFFPTEDSLGAEKLFFNSCRFLLISDISEVKNG